MKCPICRIENPPSTTVCQCGHNLKEKDTNVHKSLAEQAQEIREEIKNARASVPKARQDTQEEANEASPVVPIDQVETQEAFGEATAEILVEHRQRETTRENILAFLGIGSVLFGGFWLLEIVMLLFQVGLRAEELIGAVITIPFLVVLPIAVGLFLLGRAFAEPVAKQKGMRLFTKKSILVATVIGGPLAAGMMFAQNFRNLGNDLAARNSLLIGAAYLVALRGGYEGITTTGPVGYGMLLFVAFINYLAANYLFEVYQGFQVRMFLEEGGRKATVWNTLSVLAGVLLLVILNSLLVLMFVQPLTANPDLSSDLGSAGKTQNQTEEGIMSNSLFNTVLSPVQQKRLDSLMELSTKTVARENQELSELQEIVRRCVGVTRNASSYCSRVQTNDPNMEVNPPSGWTFAYVKPDKFQVHQIAQDEGLGELHDEWIAIGPDHFQTVGFWFRIDDPERIQGRNQFHQFLLADKYLAIADTKEPIAGSTYRHKGRRYFVIEYLIDEFEGDRTFCPCPVEFWFDTETNLLVKADMVFQGEGGESEQTFACFNEDIDISIPPNAVTLEK